MSRKKTGIEPLGNKKSTQVTKKGSRLSMLKLYLFQVTGLCYKSLLTLRTSIVGVVIAVVLPALFLNVVVTSIEDAIQGYLDKMNQTSDVFSLITDIPPCTVGRDKKFCKALSYYPPDDLELQALAHEIALSNDPPLSEGPWDDHTAQVSPCGFNITIAKPKKALDGTIEAYGWNDNLNTTAAILVNDSGSIYLRLNNTLFLDHESPIDAKRQYSPVIYFKHMLRAVFKKLIGDGTLDGSKIDLTGLEQKYNINAKLVNSDSAFVPDADDVSRLAISTVFSLIAGPVVCAATMAVSLPALLVAVEEKVEKVIEYYSLLGVRRFVYLSSKFVTSLGVGLLTGTALTIFESSAKVYMMGRNVSFAVRYTVYATSGFLWSVYGFWLSGKPKNRKKAISRGIQRYTFYFVANIFVYLMFGISQMFVNNTLMTFCLISIFVPSYAIQILCAMVSIEAGQKGLATYVMSDMTKPFTTWMFSPIDVVKFVLCQAIFIILYYQYRVTAKGYDGSTPQKMFFILKPSFWKAIFKKKTTVAEESKLLMVEASPDILREKKKAARKDSNALLRVVNLTKVYQSEGRQMESKVAVSEISFVVEKGDIVFVAGASGCGKTSTLKCISGVESITSGSILLDGVDTAGMTSSNIAFLPQETSYFKGMSGINNVRIGMLFGGHLPLRAHEIVEKVSLNKSEYSRNIDGYSGGMKKRISLATTIATLPDENGVLILDEATTGVDLHTRTALWRCISELREKHAILLSSHCLQEGEELASKVLIMVNGNIAAVGSPKYLSKKYQTYPRLIMRATEDMRALTNLTRHIPPALRSSMTVSTDSAGALVVVLNRMARGQVASLLEALEGDAEFKDSVHSHGLASASLQSVFIAITASKEKPTSGHEDQSPVAPEVSIDVVAVDEPSVAQAAAAKQMKHPYSVYNQEGEIFATVDLRPKFASFDDLKVAVQTANPFGCQSLGMYMFGVYDQASTIVPLLCNHSDNVDITVGDRPVFVIKQVTFRRQVDSNGNAMLVAM